MEFSLSHLPFESTQTHFIAISEVSFLRRQNCLAESSAPTLTGQDAGISMRAWLFPTSPLVFLSLAMLTSSSCILQLMEDGH